MKKQLSLILLGALPLAAGCDGAPADPSLLTPPPAGEGVQLETPDLVVAPGDEIQNCYFYKVSELNKLGGIPEDEPLNLHHVEIAQRDGSHHMNIFRVGTIYSQNPDGGLDPEKGDVESKNGQGACFNSGNWADWPLIVNSQKGGEVDWEFPEGVANVLQPDEWIMLQTHWVNATTQDTPDGAGRVRVNFWSMPTSEVKHQMGTLFATKQSIRVCQSNPKPEYSGSCQFNSEEGVTIIGANGHFHSRGKQFDMFRWDGISEEKPADGERFYRSEAWDEPPMMHSPDLNEVIPPGGGVFYTCNYEWKQPDPAVGCSGLDEFDQKKYMTTEENLDCCYTFGPIVEKNEHCNIFVYYYPAIDTKSVNCF